MNLTLEDRAWAPVRALPAAMRRARPWRSGRPHKFAPTAASTAIFGQAIFAKIPPLEFQQAALKYHPFFESI
jgi:hypothetical protein